MSDTSKMTALQREAYEKGFYAAVHAKETPEVGYSFATATRLCPYDFAHPHRPYWMKGWLNAE